MPQGGISVWLGALIGSLAAALGSIVGAIPAFLGAIVILLIGWGLGKLVQLVIGKGLHALRFDDLMSRAGVTHTLERGGVKSSPSSILGIVAYWFVFLIAINAAVGVLGIGVLTALMTTVVLYLPRIFAALLIILFGAWVANWLSDLTRTSARASNIGYADMLGSIVQGAVLFFIFAIALDVLGLQFPFLVTAFAILLGGLVLAGALAFGLGGREYASDVLAGRELRMMFSPGDRVTSDRVDGTISRILPTVTMVQTAQGDVAVQNSELMHQHVTRSSGGRLPGEGMGGTSRAA